MRNFVILLALALLFSSPAFAAEPAQALVCEQASIAASATYTGAAIDVSRAEGFFTVSVNQVGAGPVDVAYEVSVNGLDWAAPAGAEPVIEDAGQGLTFRSFEPVYAPWMRLKITNTGASAVTITARVAYR